MTHDSLVTVRLSEPPALTVDTSVCSEPVPDILVVTGTDISSITPTKQTDAMDEKTATRTRSTATLLSPDPARSLQDELGIYQHDDDDSSDDQEEVNWAELEKTEDEQAKEDEADNVCQSRLISALQLTNTDTVNRLTVGTVGTGKCEAGY
jgi:hypothetical protein